MLDHAWPAGGIGGVVKGDDVVLAVAHDDLFVGGAGPHGAKRRRIVRQAKGNREETRPRT